MRAERAENARKPAATAHTIASVTGKASHTPVSAHSAHSKNAAGRMTMSPRSRETICAGRARYSEEKYEQSRMFTAANGMAIKYRRSPRTAISRRA